MATTITQAIMGIADWEATGRKWWRPLQIAFVVAAFITIGVCEWIFAYHNVTHGIIIALGLVMMIYIVLAVFRFNPVLAICAESLALIPLYILFTSSLPWFFIDQNLLLPAVYSCIIALCLLHVYQKKLDLKQLFGFSKKKLLKYTLLGLVIGSPLGFGEYAILQPAPAFPTFELKYYLRDWIYMLFFVGLAEELLFRGFIQEDFTRAFGWKWGLFGASAMFAIMHLTWRSIPELGFVFIAGVILGILYIKTKSLIAPIVAHAANNVMLVAVLPYVFAR